jgi:predicted dinucleotide-binding enzyme
MRIAVLGTGIAGRTLAQAFGRLGHEVVVGTRDPEVTRGRDDWTLDLPLAAYGEVAEGADLVVNATNGLATLAVLRTVGAEALAGKVLLDVANALDASQGFPPRLAVADGDSLAEQIQRAFPETRVVKSLNTVNCAVMVDPKRVGDGLTTMFVAGDDVRARETVVSLLGQLGWFDIIEFGHLSAARGMEMWLPLWIRLMGRLGAVDFNLKIVR